MTKSVAGIQGVLGNYITRADAPQLDQPNRKQSDESIANPPARKRKSRHRSATRLGRPPGRPGTKTKSKDKVTLRIDAAIMSDYREWSWEERCQLGELVERALVEYRRRHR